MSRIFTSRPSENHEDGDGGVVCPSQPFDSSEERGKARLGCGRCQRENVEKGEKWKSPNGRKSTKEDVRGGDAQQLIFEPEGAVVGLGAARSDQHDHKRQ